ncbi:MAG: hypothetical protein ACYCX7_01575 [Solirubrobacteraceae bacterium]
MSLFERESFLGTFAGFSERGLELHAEIVDVRNLGVLRESADGDFRFVPSHRRMPHVGAKVGFLSGPALRFVASAELPDQDRVARIGYLAFGEFVYAGERSDAKLNVHSWMELGTSEHLLGAKVVEPLRSDRRAQHPGGLAARLGRRRAHHPDGSASASPPPAGGSRLFIEWCQSSRRAAGGARRRTHVQNPLRIDPWPRRRRR